MNKVNQLRPTDLETQVDLRFKATYDALEKLRENIAVIPGRKQPNLGDLWNSELDSLCRRKIGSTARRCCGNWQAVTTNRRQRFIRVDPGINLSRGQLNRDSLDILTGITGGRTFGTSDMRDAAVRAVADARASYSLTYVPPGDAHAGKFR